MKNGLGHTRMEYIKFTKRDPFSKELAQHVNDYLRSKNLTRSGSWKIYLKIPFLYALYIVPFLLMISGVITDKWLLLLMAAIMGLGMAGIGLSIMHDANHGSFSRRTWVNKIMSYSMELLGGSALNWRIQHNVLHHSFTNVHDLDDDIKPPGILRFSPNEPVKKIHKYQVYYAWFFYGLLTLSWMTNKDFRQLNEYYKRDLLKSQGYSFKKAFAKLLFFKVLYYAIIAGIPLLTMDITWWQYLIGFLVMHFVSGSLLSFIFQPAHVMPETAFPTVENRLEENPDESWAIHQMKTTANFENWNPVLTWFAGGLNFQIEHHLFPDISHIHYPKISKIVRKIAAKHNVPYHYHKTWVGAIYNHLKLLNKLGNPQIA